MASKQNGCIGRNAAPIAVTYKSVRKQEISTKPKQARPVRLFRTVERQGWRDRALQGRIHGRVLNNLTGLVTAPQPEGYGTELPALKKQGANIPQQLTQHGCKTGRIRPIYRPVVVGQRQRQH